MFINFEFNFKCTGSNQRPHLLRTLLKPTNIQGIGDWSAFRLGLARSAK